jgi:hypothetical protein
MFDFETVPGTNVWQTRRDRPRFRFRVSMVSGHASMTMTGALDAVNYADAEQQIVATAKSFGVDDWHIDSIEQG